MGYSLGFSVIGSSLESSVIESFQGSIVIGFSLRSSMTEFSLESSVVGSSLGSWVPELSPEFQYSFATMPYRIADYNLPFAQSPVKCIAQEWLAKKTSWCQE